MQDDVLRTAAEAAKKLLRELLDEAGGCDHSVDICQCADEDVYDVLEAALNAPRDTPSTMTVEELQQFLWENDTGYDPLDPRATQIVAMYRQQAEALHPLLTPSTVQRELPRYKCHKEVWALKIKSIVCDGEGENRETDGSAIITPEEEGYAPFKVDHNYTRKHKPVAGGYYVVYKGGYKSFSPAEAFEDGYTAA